MVDLDDRACGGAVDFLMADRFVDRGIELFARLAVTLDAGAPERRKQLALHEPQALEQLLVDDRGVARAGDRAL